MKTIDAMRQALDTLQELKDNEFSCSWDDSYDAVKAALREAIAHEEAHVTEINSEIAFIKSLLEALHTNPQGELQ